MWCVNWCCGKKVIYLLLSRFDFTSTTRTSNHSLITVVWCKINKRKNYHCLLTFSDVYRLETNNLKVLVLRIGSVDQLLRPHDRKDFGFH